MKLVLHIGSEKTGTTSTQNWCHENRQQLIDEGVYYSRVLGDRNHTKLYLWAIPDDQYDDGYSNINILTSEERRKFKEALPSLLDEEIARAKELGCNVFLISNEHCQSRLISNEMVSRIYDFLSKRFQNIEIYCSLRPQIDTFLSFASTWSRGQLHVTKDLLNSVIPENPYYNYYEMVKRWSSLFGKSSINPNSFKTNPNFTEIISSNLKLNTSSFFPVQRHNESIDVRMMALINALPLRPAEEPITPLDFLYIDEFPCKEKLRIDKNIAQEVQSKFNKVNNNIYEMFENILEGDLEPDWNKYADYGNFHLLEQECAFGNELRTLINFYNTKIGLAESHHLLTRCEHALSLGQKNIAQDHVNQAKIRLSLFKNSIVLTEQIVHLNERIKSSEAKLQS